MKPGGKRRWIWFGAVVALALAVVIWDPFEWQTPRAIRSLPQSLKMLMADLTAKEPRYLRWITFSPANTFPGYKSSFQLAGKSIPIPPKLIEAALKKRDINYLRKQRAKENLCREGTNAYPAIPALVKCLQSDDVQLRTDAFNVLYVIHADADPRMRECLRACTDVTPVLATFESILKPTGSIIYLNFYNYGPVSCTDFTLSTISQMGPKAKPLLPAVIHVAQTRAELSTRIRAIQCAVSLGPDARDMLPYLDALLRDPADWAQIRGTTVDALQRIAPDDPDTIPRLKELIRDEQAMVRVKSAMALWRCKAISAEEALAVLNHEAEHKLVSVRTAVMQGATEMATAARPLKPKAEKCLVDEDERVRTAATNALAKING